MRKFLFTTFFALLAAACFAASVNIHHLKSDLVEGGDDIFVITPDNPDGKTFPTVYLLNGFGGDRNQFLRLRPDLPRLADHYGIIFVLPSGKDSWYWDSPVKSDMQMESFITKELIPWIDANYPTKAEASQRAVSGLSMGATAPCGSQCDTLTSSAR